LSDENPRETSRTQTRTRSDDEDSNVDEASFLTPEEERVVRARHGLSEDDDHELSFALGADEATEAKLAELEQFLVEAFEPRQQEGGDDYLPDSIEALEEGGADEAIVEALREARPDDPT
jgi:hypothetical protein